MDAYSYIWYMFPCLCLRTSCSRPHHTLLLRIHTWPSPPVRLPACHVQAPIDRSYLAILYPCLHTTTTISSCRHQALAHQLYPGAPVSPSKKERKKESDTTYLCLCFGFLLQIMYTYLPFFLRTLLHPSHSFFTDDRTFMPRVCCCIRSPANRDDRLAIGEDVLWRHGRAAGVWRARERVDRRAGVVERKVRRSGRRSVRASIVAAGEGIVFAIGAGGWAQVRSGCGAGWAMGARGEVLGLWKITAHGPCRAMAPAMQHHIQILETYSGLSDPRFDC
ncbi:hypothetical protein PMIN01_06672 [Paraphaeosphaeria minitans]|uniref:Uncharacterized protein n=1 Tax=Paraphaeosphaeria minitans TaxID=565426 RepID=A0A9P6GGN0_9PLEO|nr:hypothetical protein PMIN01_06672 [Paraphaeosphaeria minitans]